MSPLLCIGSTASETPPTTFRAPLKLESRSCDPTGAPPCATPPIAAATGASLGQWVDAAPLLGCRLPRSCTTCAASWSICCA
eukprot:2537422-Prymnesium_polylepis.1